MPSRALTRLCYPRDSGLTGATPVTLCSRAQLLDRRWYRSHVGLCRLGLEIESFGLALDTLVTAIAYPRGGFPSCICALSGPHLEMRTTGSTPAADFALRLPGLNAYRVRLIRSSRGRMSPAVTGFAAPMAFACHRPFPNRTDPIKHRGHEVEAGDCSSQAMGLLPAPLPARSGRLFGTHYALRRHR
jgi:hypothetical protein